MILYEECHELQRPPAMVASAVAGQFGASAATDGRETHDDTDDPDERDRPDEVRRWSSTGRLLTRRATLDPAAGELQVTLLGPDAYRHLALTGLVVAPSVVWLAPPGGLLVVLAAVYATLAAVPGVHLLPGVPSLPDIDGAEPVSQRHAPTTAATYLVVGAVLYVALVRRGLARGAVAAGVVFVGVAVAHLGTARRTTGVPALGIALAGLVPAVLSGANVLFATALLDGGGTDATGVVVVLAVAVALDVLFFGYCSRVATEVARAAPSPAGRRRRVVGLAAVILANLALLGATVLAARALTADGGALSRALSPLGPAGTVATVAAAGVLLLPVVVTAAGWCHHLVTGTAAGVWAVVHSEPVDLQSLPDGVSVRVIDSSAPVARPLRLPGRSTVLLGRPLVEALDREALAAVACHESYHLVGRDPATGALPRALGALVGGPSAVHALYDRRAVERAADEFAADRVGSDALVRAVRTVSRLHLSDRAGPGPPSDRSETATEAVAPGSGDRLRTRLARGLMAPYRLYFGDLVPTTHDGVTERIARIQARGDGDRAGGP